jgi:predicted  nucleic acid-binding Zn-ribbon protein
VEVNNLKKDLEKLEQSNKQLQSTVQQKSSLIGQLENKITSLNAAIASGDATRETLEKEVVSLSGSIKNSQDQVNTFKKRCEALDASLKAMTMERDQAKGTIIDKDGVISERNKRIEALEGEIRSGNSRMNDLLKRMTVESETTKKALEKSISSSVRLCVVAPTVNVHVNDGKTKHKSRSLTLIVYLSSYLLSLFLFPCFSVFVAMFANRLSENNLKTFLQNEVFDKYCFLFKQTSENGSPVSGENLEIWLQKMLSQMQSSIENHVNSAMEGSSM